MRRPTAAGSLYRLIYCSRLNTEFGRRCDATSSLDDIIAEIRTILTISRRRNRAENITGALLFTPSGFAQVLEGPREVVERTYDRIALDPRHRDVVVLSFTPTERRCFPDWPMGFCGQTTSSRADPLAYLVADASHAGPRATTGSDVLRMLESVVQKEDEWIAA